MRANSWSSSSMLLVPLITAAAATSTLAAEFPKPVTQWSCAEFLSVDDEFKPTVISWATTLAKGGQPEAAAIDIKGIERVTTQIIGEGATGLILVESERRMEEGRGRAGSRVKAARVQQLTSSCHLAVIRKRSSLATVSATLFGFTHFR